MVDYFKQRLTLSALTKDREREGISYLKLDCTLSLVPVVTIIEHEEKKVRRRRRRIENDGTIMNKFNIGGG